MAVISAQDSANNFKITLEVSEVSTSSDNNSKVSWSYYITGIGVNHFETYWIPRVATINGTRVVDTSSPTRCNRGETVSWGSGILEINQSASSIGKIDFSFSAQGLGDYSWTGTISNSGTLTLQHKSGKDDTTDDANKYLVQKFKVISTVWDVVNERYKQIELGESQSTLSDVVTGAIEDTSAKVTSQKLVSVNQRIDYETGVISNRIAAVEDRVEGVETSTSEISQTVDSISLSVSSITTIGEGISIGGRNILLNTATLPLGDASYSTATWGYRNSDNNNPTNNTTFSVSDPPANGIVTGARIECTGDEEFSYITQNYIPGLSNAAKYTLSGYYRISSLSSATSVRFWLRERSNGAIADLNVTGTLDSTTWKAFAYTFVSTIPNNQSCHFNFGLYHSIGIIEYCGLKLERGSTKTDWSAAPEDIKQYADTVTSTAVTQLSSQINQTAEGITSEVQKIQNGLAKNIEDGVSTYLENSEYVTQSDLSQTAQDITASFSETVKTVEDNKTYVDSVSTYITANAEGLSISKSNSQFKSLFTESSLDFKDRSDNRLAWVDTEGLGGEEVSIGDSTNQTERWRIFTVDNGKHLRFTRHQ